MDQHIFKWKLFRKFKRAKDHSRNPKVNNVIPCNEYVRWIVTFHIVCLLGPTERREWPQCRTEPRIQYVFILFDVSTLTMRTPCHIFSRYSNFKIGRASCRGRE